MKDFFMSSYACKEYLYWNKFQASVSYFATWLDINKKTPYPVQWFINIYIKTKDTVTTNINILRPEQKGQHFADNILECIFSIED